MVLVRQLADLDIFYGRLPASKCQGLPLATDTATDSAVDTRIADDDAYRRPSRPDGATSASVQPWITLRSSQNS